MKKSALTLLLLSFCLCLHAQKLRDLKEQDTMIHVFRLDATQLQFILNQGGISDTGILFTHRFKDFPRRLFKNDTLPYGNFISVDINKDDVRYRHIQRMPFDITHRILEDEVILYLRHKRDRSLIKHATLTLDGKALHYDEGFGGYVFLKKSLDAGRINSGKVMLHTTFDGELYVQQYGFQNVDDQVRNRERTVPPSIMASPGYLITDKPLYKPLDTLRLKAFLVKLKKGRPLRKKVQLSITEGQQDFKFSRKLRSTTPGAYLFDWVIPDTLKIDRNFDIRLSYKRGFASFYKSTSFYLEDYQLAKNTYEVEPLSELFFAGEDIAFFAGARDANGFPIPNTHVHYNLAIQELNKLLTDTIRIPAEKLSSWYSGDTVINYENFIRISIPSSVLPKANARYTLDVVITDPVTFEKKSFSKTITKLTEKEKLLFFQQEDTLHIRNLYNLRDTARPYTLITLNGNDTVAIRKITTPYRHKLSSAENRAVLLDQDSVATPLVIGWNQLLITRLEGKRKHDSVEISFKYPFSEPVYYKIYKDKQLVRSGNSTVLDLRIPDNSKSSWSILLTTDLKREIAGNFVKITYVPKDKIIQLKNNLPSTAFPGQELAVSLGAYDFYNKPLAGINIAAYAINKMFDDRIVTPGIDVPDAYRNRVNFQYAFSADAITFSLRDYINNYKIRNHHIERFQLLRNEYYKMKYPADGYALIELDKQQPRPEFCVAVTSKASTYTPKYVTLDGQQVYYNDINEKQAYSIPATEGTHSIEFRYFDRKYRIDNIQFRKYTKHILCFNMDSLKEYNPLIKISDSLNPFEPVREELSSISSSVLITNIFPFDTLRLIEDNKVMRVFTNIKPAIMNIDGDNFYVLGPIHTGKQNTLSFGGREYSLKGGAQYAHYYDQVLKTFTTKNLGQLKGNIFRFSETYLATERLLELQQPDTLATLPETQKGILNRRAFEAHKEKQDIAYEQQYKSSGGAGQFSLFIVNNRDSIQVKSVWLIHHTNAEWCDYYSNITKVDKFPVYKNAADALYDIYLLMNNNKMIALRNLYFRNNDQFYIDPYYMRTEEITNEKLELPLKIYTDLTRVPMVPFYYAPDEVPKMLKETKNPKRSNPYISGLVTDASLSPLDGCLVYAEINGQYRSGAVTNANGEFEMLNMPPGNYQLKFFHSEYLPVYINNVMVRSGNDYRVNTALNTRDLNKPVYESFNNDFRFRYFIRDKKANTIQFSFYDKESREPLSQVSIEIREGDTLFSKTESAAASRVLSKAPNQQDKKYKLIITRKGYRSIVINDIIFSNGYYAEAEFFLVANEGNATDKKEYSLGMTDGLPDLVVNQNGIIDLTSVQVVSESYNLTVTDANAAADYQYSPSAPMNASPVSRYSADVVVTERRYVKPLINASDPGSKLSVIENASIANGAINGQGYMLREIEEEEKSVKYADGALINQVASNRNISSIRKRFSDAGYWHPNLRTNKLGQVHFTVRLPDNITTWRSYMLAMGKNWLHGVDSSETSVYKPLQAISVLPPFLYQGDALYAKTRFVNLTREPHPVTISFVVDEKEFSSKEVTITQQYVDSILLKAVELQPIVWRSGLSFENRYRDFEQLELPVHSSAMRFHRNQSIHMDGDTTYTLRFANNTRGSIILNNSIYEKILEEIRQLNNFEYNCLEQTASKLKALLYRNRIAKELKLKENHNKEIYRLLALTGDYQNTDGSFGWWRKSGTHYRMSIYAMEVLHQANAEGYHNSHYLSTRNFLAANINYMSRSDLLYCLYVFKEMKFDHAAALAEFKKISTDDLSTTDKIYYYGIQKQQGIAVEPSDLYALYLAIEQKLQQPAYDNFFEDARADIFSSWNVFRGSGLAGPYLELFRKKLLSGQLENNLNTFSRAQLIEALCSLAAGNKYKSIPATVTINNKDIIKTFPYTLPITASDYTLQHAGAAVYLNTAEEHFVSNPSVHDSLFSVSTRFMQQQTPVQTVALGKDCNMEVSLRAFRSATYVMLEIPIPSGMQITQKPQPDAGMYIEYYKHKVVVFYQSLPMGDHALTLHLNPIFRGTFTLPAAKASLMYYPFVYGNNRNTTVVIE